MLDSRWGINQGFARYFDDFDLSRYEKQAGMDASSGPATRRWTRRCAGSGRTSDSRSSRPPLRPAHAVRRAADYAAQFPRTLAGAYDAEIAYADAQLGRILGALESDGRIDRTVIAVLGDHGEMLGEHGELTHGFFVYDAAVRIRVIVAPGLAARVVKTRCGSSTSSDAARAAEAPGAVLGSGDEPLPLARRAAQP